MKALTLTAVTTILLVTTQASNAEWIKHCRASNGQFKSCGDSSRTYNPSKPSKSWFSSKPDPYAHEGSCSGVLFWRKCQVDGDSYVPWYSLRSE